MATQLEDDNGGLQTLSLSSSVSSSSSSSPSSAASAASDEEGKAGGAAEDAARGAHSLSAALGDDIDIYRGIGPDRMFLSYAVEVNSYNKVTMVDDLAMLALKRLRKLGRLSKDMRKVAPQRRASRHTRAHNILRPTSSIPLSEGVLLPTVASNRPSHCN